MYRDHQLFLMLLKLDVFFFVAFSLQLVVLVLDPSDIEFTLTIAAIPLSVIILMLAVYALHKEKKSWMITFICGLGVGIGYFAFKLFRFYQPSQAHKYEGSRKFLTFFGKFIFDLINFNFIFLFRCCFVNGDICHPDCFHYML
jgi:hypothetical protein